MVVWVTLMFGKATEKASIADFRAVPSAGDDSHWPSVTSPLMELGSNVLALSTGCVSPAPAEPGAFDEPPPPHAAARNMTANERVRKRLRMDVASSDRRAARLA